MTLKQKKLIQGVANGKSQTQAAIDAGYAPANANVTASQTLASPNVKSALAALMDKQGLSEERLLEPIAVGLDANRDDAPDHTIRLKAAELGWKLRGQLQPGVSQTFNGPAQLNIVHSYRPSTNGHSA